MWMTDTRRAGEKQNPVYISGQQRVPAQVLLGQGKDSAGEGLAGALTSAGNADTAGVVLEISKDGKALQNGVPKQQDDDVRRMLKWEQEMYKQQAEASDKAAKAAEDVSKVMEIARRIARGDIVPLKDEKKLLEFNADLYQAAKAAALVNADRKHKKYKSLYNEDEDVSMRDKIRALNREKEAANAEAVSAAMTPPGGGAGEDPASGES